MKFFDGTDRHDLIDVNRPNSIENRLIKVLQYLNNDYPNENWNQFWSGDSTILWENIIVSGHSQGGGHAGFIGKIKQVERVVMFAINDWMPLLQRTSAWVSMPGATIPERYFAFTHELDEAADFGNQQIFWEDLGMMQFGNVVLTDGLSVPFENSHTLFTQVIPAVDTTKYHSSPIVDLYTPKDGNDMPVLQLVWEYLIDYPLVTSLEEMEEENSLFKIYPNPASSMIWIEFENGLAKNCSAKIYNSIGQEVHSFFINEKKKGVSVQGLPSGVYFLTLKMDDKFMVRQLVKK